MKNHALILAGILVVVVGGGIAATAYIAARSHTVSIDQAQVQAPVVSLSPTSGGTLRHIYVNEGDTVAPGTVVAQVGVELIKAAQGGLVIAVHGDEGDKVAPGTPVVDLIDPDSLRVVGQLDENKGLSRIKVGQPVRFTVDAFGGTQYTAVVSEVAPTSKQSGVVFNISSQRQVQQFYVKAAFDISAHPELKNGMSARMTVWVD